MGAEPEVCTGSPLLHAPALERQRRVAAKGQASLRVPSPTWPLPFLEYGPSPVVLRRKSVQGATVHQKRHPQLQSGRRSAKRTPSFIRQRPSSELCQCLLQVSLARRGARAAFTWSSGPWGGGRVLPNRGALGGRMSAPGRSCNGPGHGIQAGFLAEAVIRLSFEDKGRGNSAPG